MKRHESLVVALFLLSVIPASCSSEPVPSDAFFDASELARLGCISATPVLGDESMDPAMWVEDFAPESYQRLEDAWHALADWESELRRQDAGIDWYQALARWKHALQQAQAGVGTQWNAIATGPGSDEGFDFLVGFTDANLGCERARAAQSDVEDLFSR